MYIIHVHVHVKPEHVETFKAATRENALVSLGEPGIVRFDVIQDTSDPSRFVLVEVYRTPDDPASHKETSHYNRWREMVEPMLAEPRTRIVYHNTFPDEDGW